MAHDWDSYFPNLQPPPSNPRPLEMSSVPEGNLSQPIENFTAHHDEPNMVVSQEAVSTISDFSSNLYKPQTSVPTSDCAFSYFSDIPWQSDEQHSVKDGSSKCANGDFSNLTEDGLAISNHFPSFAANLQEIKEDCEILAPSFLEDYSDVSSCSDVNETEIRPSCKYMKSSEPKTPSHDSLSTTKHSPSEWPFSPTVNMSISADFPTSQMSETAIILPIPFEVHKARDMADCAEEIMETKENPYKCEPNYPTPASSKTSETGNAQEDNAGTKQNIEEKKVSIQALNITMTSDKDMAVDVKDRYPDDCGKEHPFPEVDECRNKTPLGYNHFNQFLSIGKDFDVKIQGTGKTLFDTIQDNKEVCNGNKTIDSNHISPSLHENRMGDTFTSATECPGLFDSNVSHSQDTIHELDDNTGTLEAVETTNGLERTNQGISQFQLPAQPSSESRPDIICSDHVEDSKCDSMDACYNKPLSDSGRLVQPLPESELTDPLHQPKLYSIVNEEKTLPNSFTATERHNEDASGSMKEYCQETLEQPDLGMLYGEPLSRADSPCEDPERSHSDEERPVASLENSSILHLEVQVAELKPSLHLQKKLQPIIILKTIEPVNDIKEYRCTECQYSTQNVDNLITHYHSHPQQDFHFCPTCNIYLLNDDPPSKHVCDVTSYILPKKMLRKKLAHTCKICSHASRRFYQHVRHMRTHTGITPFKCNGCSQYFSQSSCLYKHMRVAGRCRGSKHKKFPKNWNINKTTKPKQVMENIVECNGLKDCYVKLVDISRTNVCPYCSKTFTSSKMTNKHVRSVHKVKGVLKGREKGGADEFGKYKCQFCPRVFKYSYNRVRHLRGCIKEITNGSSWKIGSKYQCPLCKAKFSFPNNRTRHIQKNCLNDFIRQLYPTRRNPVESCENEERPLTATGLEDKLSYKCSLCPASFFHLSGKYKHMKKHELCKPTGYPILKKKQENITSETSVKCMDTLTSNKANDGDVFSCPFCGKSFNTSLSLKKHETSHKGDRPYHCLECGKRFLRHDHLTSHKKVHQRRIQCTVCRKILTTVGELIQHRKTHSKRGKLKCPYCPMQFDYPAYLLRHLVSQHKSQTELGKEELQVKPRVAKKELPLKSLKKPKVCSLCNQVFQNPQFFRKHCLKHIRVSSLQCPFCHHLCHSRRSLVHHIERHSGDKPLQCNACGKRFHRTVNLKIHKKRCSASKLDVNKLEVVEVVQKPAGKCKVLHCSYCPRTFDRKIPFKKHHFGHISKSLLTCSKCAQFYGRSKISQHEINCQGTTAIDQHGKSLQNEVEQKVGKKNRINGTQTKTFLHICPHCQKAFQYRSRLLRHMISHEETMCIKHKAFCGGFVRKDHSKINKYNRPRLLRPIGVKEAQEKMTEYKCKFCTKTFWKASNLRSHILTHTEVKPYRCKACDSCFSRYDHLRLHQTRCKGKRQRLEVCLPKISLDAIGKGWQKQSHGLAIAEEQTFECNFCSQIFTCKSNLTRHVSMLHNKSAFSNSQRKKPALSTGMSRLLESTQILEPSPIKKQSYVCKYCPRSFKLSCHLRVHTRLHTGEKPFLCDVCGERFMRKDYLLRHSLKCNPGNDSLPCHQCEQLFPKEFLKIHQMACSKAPSVSGDLQKSSESTSNGFSCAYCNSTFLIFSQLQQHFLNAHKQDTVMSPSPTTSLQQHLANIVSVKEEPLDDTHYDKLINDGNTHVDDAEKKPFPCSFCNLRFVNKAGLGGHLRLHTKTTLFSCLRCKKIYCVKSQYRTHLRKCKQLEMQSNKNDGLKSSVAISSEIDSAQNDSVLVFKEGSEIDHRGTGVLQTKFSCKDNSDDSPQEEPVQGSSVEKKAVRYQCSECDKSFTDGLILISHLEEHGRLEQKKNCNTCPECGKVCNNGASLDRHMKVHGIDKTYPCLECSKRFTTLKKLLVHKKHHKKEISPFVCRTCSQRCLSPKLLLEHYSENHPNELYFCKLCSKRYTLKRSLIRHYKMRHFISQLDQYIDCSENDQIIDHGSIEVSASGCSDKDAKTDEDCDSENDRDENSDSDAAPYFPCHVCGKTFLTSENLEDHQRCHLGEKPHECEECGKCFFQASQLLQHQRTHKSEFQCQTCHRGFVSLFALRNHKHTHGKNRPYRCSKCDLSFTGHSQLAEHMAMHREDNFPCDICNRTFSCKSSRAEHRRSHSATAGDLPPLRFEEEEMDKLPLTPSQGEYRCGVCHQCFKDPQVLSEHGCLAAKERPFSCSVCAQYFLHESHLNKHKAINHGPQSDEFLCNQCHIPFSTEKLYLFHVRNHCDMKAELNIKEEEEEHPVENTPKFGVPQMVIESRISNTENTDLVVVQKPLPIHYQTHECTICKLTFPTKNKMKKHERCHSTAATQFECTGCGQNFLGSDAFRQHNCSSSVRTSESSSTLTNNSPVSCQSLGEEEDVDVTGEDVFNCLVCLKRFSTKSSLLEHQNEHHPFNLFKCEMCGINFQQKRELIEHERTHIRGRNAKATVKKKTQLSCFQCPTMFDTVQAMALHMKTDCQQTSGQYRCDMCYKSFSHLPLLKQHQESHVGQVVYECTDCDKAFAFLHLLEKHQLTHAGPSK